MRFLIGGCLSWPALQDLLARKLFPPGLGPLSAVPRTGPAPILMRASDWVRVAPRWESIGDQARRGIVQQGWARRGILEGILGNPAAKCANACVCVCRLDRAARAAATGTRAALCSVALQMEAEPDVVKALDW